MTANAPTARLFLALWPPPDIRLHLQALQQHWSWPPHAAPVPAGQLHLTLHFLGNVPVARLEEFARALDVPAEPAALDLAGGTARLWPGGLAVLELAAPPPLLRLHAALAGALAGLGWPVASRPFRPHVTLARRAAGARPPAAGTTPPACWQADQGHVLVRSSPARGYEVLRAYRPP